MPEQQNITDQEADSEAKPGKLDKVIFGLVAILLLSGLSWVFVPSVRVLGYQTILIVGPVSARRWSAEKLGGYGELAVEPLIMALEDKASSVRYKAAWALGKIGRAGLLDHGPAKAEKAVPALIQALKYKDRDVRYGAAKALGNIGPKAVPSLIEALKDKDSGVRQYKDGSVRQYAVAILGDIGPKAEKAVPSLIEALKDKDGGVRGYAAWALGEIGRYVGPRNAGLPDHGPAKAERAVPALTQALKDKDSGVRQYAKAALEKIQKQ
jgi:HEAT repeat protein